MKSIFFCTLILAVVEAGWLGWLDKSDTVQLFIALVALFGVLLTIQADRDKAAEDRRFIAKQDAFIQAADAMGSANLYLMNLADKNLPTDGEVDKELKDFVPAFIRPHFYCDFSTTEVCMNYGRTFTTCLEQVFRAKVASMQFDGEIGNNARTIERVNKSVDRFMEEYMILMRENSSHPLIPHVKAAIAADQGQLANLYSAQAELLAKKSGKVSECRRIAHEKFLPLNQFTKQLLLNARRELQFPIEEEKYAKMWDDNSSAASSFLSNFMHSIESDIAAQGDAPKQTHRSLSQ